MSKVHSKLFFKFMMFIMMLFCFNITSYASGKSRLYSYPYRWDGTHTWPNLPYSGGFDLSDRPHMEYRHHSDGSSWDRRDEYQGYGNHGPFVCAKAYVEKSGNTTTVIIEDMQAVVPDNNEFNTWDTEWSVAFPGASELYTRRNTWDKNKGDLYDGVWSSVRANSNGEFTYTVSGDGLYDHDNAACYNAYGKRRSFKIVYKNLSTIPKWTVGSRTYKDAYTHSFNGTNGYGSSSGHSIIYVLCQNTDITNIVPSDQFHKHNRNKYKVTSSDDNYEYGYYYCDANDGDHGDSTKRAHSYSAWSAWKETSTGTRQRTRTCSSCNHIQMEQQYYLTVQAGRGIANVNGSGWYYKGNANITATVKDGYTWNTWSNGNKNINATVYISAPLTLTASATPITYTITYLPNDSSSPIKAVVPSSPITYTVEDHIILPKATRTAYTFSGWTEATRGKISEIKAGTIGNLVFTANWTANKYRIIPVAFTGDCSHLPTEYTADDEVDIGEITLSKYDFLGWTINCKYGEMNENGKLTLLANNIASKNIHINKGTYGDITITAHYSKTKTSDETQYETSPDDDGSKEHITDTGKRKEPIVEESDTKHNTFEVNGR